MYRKFNDKKKRRIYCTKEYLIVALNTINQVPGKKKNKNIRYIQYYDNLLDTEKVCDPTIIAYYLHELKSYIFNPEESYDIDKEYFIALLVIFVDLYKSTIEFTSCTVPIIEDKRLKNVSKEMMSKPPSSESEK